MKKEIPFNQVWHAPKELAYLTQAITNIDGPPVFSTRCIEWLTAHTGSKAVHLTHSCTAALEMAAILANIQPGDEVIMPSFTFPSTANAFVLRGGIPVFVDIRADTLNIDETLIEAAITAKTKAIVPVHYAGVACEMDSIMAIAAKHKLLVIEDAAQSIGASYKGKPLGSIGHMGTYSFHKTKNIQCMAGGALLINREGFSARAEIIAEKGTNVRAFQRGETSHYSWRDIGSSFLMSEIHAAILLSQLEEFEMVKERRLEIWREYYQALKSCEDEGLIQLPRTNNHQHNAHTFQIIFPSQEQRNITQQALKKKGVHANTHYEPLHLSPTGRRLSKSAKLPVSDHIPARLLRLPLWLNLPHDAIGFITECIKANSSKEYF
jgi:dTDP-4-amino-4,6-dideoxygalactose transaminase